MLIQIVPDRKLPRLFIFFLDMGGLTKEWFQLLVKQIFEPDYGMFVYHPNSRCYWFSVSGSNKNLREYNLIGVLMGLAVYNRYLF